jgi:thymidylate kinase
MALICLFGPDGSGKTTMATALARKLENRNLKVKISWMRGTHTLASILARLFSKFAAFKGYDNPYYEISIPSGMRRLWQLLEFTSVLPILLVKFILPSTLGYTVIAERYIPDFLAWVSTTTRDENYLERLEARFMLALSAKANVRIYVTASEAELIKRRCGEVDQKFLSRQLKLYNMLAKIVKAYKIDTTDRSIKETLNELLNLIQH